MTLSRRAVTFSVSTNLISASLTGAMVLTLTRLDRLGEIAAYTVGTVAASFVAVLLTAGSSLAYLTGDDELRGRVRRWRLVIVLPMLSVASFAVGALYVSKGYSGVQVTAVALAIALNGVAELQYADLQRGLKFERCAMASLGSKSLALVLCVTVTTLGVALMIAAALQVVALQMLLGRRRLRLPSPLLAGATTFPPRQVTPLAIYSGAEYTGARLDTAALSFMASTHTVGAYGVVYTLFQLISSLGYTAATSLIPLRNRYTAVPDQESTLRRVERGLIVVSAVVAIGGWFAAAPLLTGLLHLHDTSAVLWLRLLLIAMPFYLVNRTVASRRIARGAYWQALHVPGLILAIGLPLLVVLLPRFGATGAAVATLGQEVSAAMLLLAVASVRSRPSARRQRTPPTTLTAG